MLFSTSRSTGCPAHAAQGLRPRRCSSYTRTAGLVSTYKANILRSRLSARSSVKVEASAGGGDEEDPDARLAELERGRRRRNASTQTKAKQPTSSAPVSKQAEWKEGKLFPEGWEDMNPLQKAAELYTGKRGILFWATKVTYASLFIIGGAWILFRVVGPLTGLYKLENDLLSPPNL